RALRDHLGDERRRLESAPPQPAARDVGRLVSRRSLSGLLARPQHHPAGRLWPGLAASVHARRSRVPRLGSVIGTNPPALPVLLMDASLRPCRSGTSSKSSRRSSCTTGPYGWPNAAST